MVVRLRNPEDIRSALDCYQANLLPEAEAICRRLLQSDGRHAGALRLLGLIASRMGDDAQTVELIERALRQQRPDIDSLRHLGKAYLRLEHPHEARKCFAKALALDAGDAAIHNDLAVALLRLGKPHQAVDSARRALVLQPDHAEAHFNMGNIQKALGVRDDALKAYERAVALRSDYAEAQNNLGIALFECGRVEESERCFRRILSARPDHVEAHFNLGCLLQHVGRREEAITCYRKVLSLQPDSVIAHINLGNALRQIGLPEDAMACFNDALDLQPDLAEAHFNLGNVLNDLGREDLACHKYRRALELKPDFLAARWVFAMAQIPAVYGIDEDPAASREAFSRELTALGDWIATTRAGNAHEAVGTQQPFYLAYRDADNRALLAEYGTLCTSAMGGWWAARQLVAGSANTSPSRVRLGIVSAHVRNHSVFNAFVKGWLLHLDATRFELLVFHLGGEGDEETAFAESRAATFVRGPKTLDQWVDAILAGRPDVLMYPEIGIDGLTTKLASLRLAPVQAATWGNPVTTGLPTIDYFLSAENLEPPNAREHYTEKLVMLPRLGCCYPAPEATWDEPDFGVLGVKPDLPLIVCPGTPFKYAPEADAVFVDIARRLGECRFLFFSYRVESLSNRLRDRLVEVFRRSGMPFERYAQFIPWQSRAAFHGLMRRASLYLDTIGFSGFNTAMQALECDLPVVSFEGCFMRGRLASGILHSAGLTDLVARTTGEYVDLAVKIATDEGYRKRVRARIAASKHVLYDDVGAVRAFEEFMVSAVAESRTPGGAPAS